MSIDQLVRLIKQINPTPQVHLSPEEKDHAYSLKTKLQNLLLETYGELFDLEPAPWDENIVLLRYRPSPLLDACHAKLHLLTAKALAQVRKADSAPEKKPARKPVRKPIAQSLPQGSPDSLNDIIEQARQHLDQYEYEEARQVLSAMTVRDKEDLLVLRRGLALLLDEVGAYDVALDLLFSLPDNLLNSEMKEATANVCWLNGRFTDARGIFEECAIRELSKESVIRYADILHRQGESRAAFDMLTYAETLSGPPDDTGRLWQDICGELLREATPFLDTTIEAFSANDFTQAEEAARSALDIFPGAERAREVLKFLHDMRNEDTIKSLWEQFHGTEDVGERASLLRILESRDERRKDEIALLLRQETARLTKFQQDNALSSLAGSLANNALKEAFEKLFPLLKEKWAIEGLQQLALQYPDIQCLLQNGEIVRLGLEEARESWLAFLELKFQSHYADPLHTLKLMKKCHRGFYRTPTYGELERRHEARQAEQSRKNVQELLDQLEAEGFDRNQTDRLISLIHRGMASLSREERGAYELRCSAALEKLTRADSQSYHIGCFRKSLLLGDIETAAQHRQMCGDSPALQEIEAETLSLFSVRQMALTGTFSTDIDATHWHPPYEGLRYIGCMRDEAFFRLKIADEHFFVIANLRHGTARRFKLERLRYEVIMVIYADCDRADYHLICVGEANTFFYVRVCIMDQTQSITAHLNLSDLLGLGQYADIEETPFLLDDLHTLYIAYTPDTDNYDDKCHGLIDLRRGRLLKNKSASLREWCFAKIPTWPPLIVIDSDKLDVYNEKLNHLRRIEFDADWEWYERIQVTPNEKAVCIFLEKGQEEGSSRGELALIVLDFDLNVRECYDDIAPAHDFLYYVKLQYDTHRDIMIVGTDFLYDYKAKRVIKEFHGSKFTASDFIAPFSVERLCSALCAVTCDVSWKTSDDSIERLNELIGTPLLYQKILEKKPQLALSAPTRELLGKIKDVEAKPAEQLEGHELRDIQELNRAVLHEAYSDLAPLSINMFSYNFCLNEVTGEYYVSTYVPQQEELIITNISSFIDQTMAHYKKAVEKEE